MVERVVVLSGCDPTTSLSQIAYLVLMLIFHFIGIITITKKLFVAYVKHLTPTLHEFQNYNQGMLF